MPPADVMAFSGGEGRVVVKLVEPPLCVASTTYIAMPPRPAVDGFMASPRH